LWWIFRFHRAFQSTVGGEKGGTGSWTDLT
jgi:hypothetical protein